MTNNTTADLDRDIAHLIDSSENGIARVPRETLVRLRALLTSPRAAGLPEGWKLVPIEPTQKMLDCWWDGLQKGAAFVNCTPRGVYGAMLDAAPAAPVAEAEPIPMLLFCPRCGTQHIDAPESEPGQLISGGPNAGRAVPPKVTWTNPPHRSHLCHACGIVWRPADVATVGVEAIETSGKADTWTKETPWIGHNWVAAQAVAANGAACQGKNCGATDGVSHSPKCVAEHEAAVTGAVAADGEAADDLLQLDVLLANLHAAVWHAGAGDDGPVDYDMAGKDEAKAIQRHVRAMLAERAAVSPATAETTWTAPKQHCQNGGDVCLAGNRDGVCCPDDSCDIDDGTRKNPATADERTAFVEKLRELGADISPLGSRDERLCITSNIMVDDVLAAARASQAAAPASKTLSCMQDEIAGVMQQAAAPALVPPFKRYNWDGKESEAGPLVFFLDVLEALKIVEDEQAAAPAEAREPIYQSRLLKAPAWTDVSRTEFEACTAKPDQFEVRTLFRVPADAGEAGAPSADLIARCVELRELSDHGESDQTALRALADTYRRDIPSVDRKAMAVSHTHRETVQYVLDAARAQGAQGAQGGKGGEA
ncbi:hypothetical protein [Burkholderia gladioli]|uniref:hypothetical protein n=1 Tax=Burkholderia gladioli TaxID=28095 RepID=UPI000BBCFDE7|nr:hypothetical protein [Burkholderia gladioli]ATF86916.1 hypothetical protein CO712_18960 [Burkholderia gladioli pv. gladioli]